MQISKIEKEYLIRSYECDKKGELRLITLTNIFQDVADSHASQIGVGIEHCMAHGLAWVGSNYHLRIKRLPQWHEKIIITSWPSEEKKLGAIRDFVVKDEKGNEIIIASSQWILINFEKKRPVSLRENLPQYTVINEHSLETEFHKIPDLENLTSQTDFKVRFDDIDINNHVNNAVYLLWATESVGNEYRSSHTPAEIEIAFKKEGLLGENIRVMTQLIDNISTHIIKTIDDERELSRIRINWK